MAARFPRYQQLRPQIEQQFTRFHLIWRMTAVRRLALLATGIIAVESCVLTRVAVYLQGLSRTETGNPAHLHWRLQNL